MPKRPVVAGGGGDNAASACGIGAVTTGAAFVSIGTSGVLFVSNDKFRPNAGARGPCLLPCGAGHLAPDGRHPVGDGQPRMAGGHSENAGAETHRRPWATKLSGPSPALFLPYLSGERTPVARCAGARPHHGAWP